MGGRFRVVSLRSSWSLIVEKMTASWFSVRSQLARLQTWSLPTAMNRSGSTSRRSLELMESLTSCWNCPASRAEVSRLVLQLYEP